LGKELLLGFHVSISESLTLAFDRALEAGCTTFQIFTRNPQRWAFKPLGEESVSNFLRKRSETDFEYIVAHMPYLPNLASPDKTIMKKSRLSLKEEVMRCDRLQINYIVAHLGSHHEKGTMVGVRNIASACNEALQASTGKSIILLENTAGQSNSVGARFEELRMILDIVERRERVGVCFDTCHAFAAGFDLSSKSGVASTISLFDELVGLEELKVVHLNDSKGALGSGLDRHEHLGHGKIGREGFRAFLHSRRVTEVPLIMETPHEYGTAAMKADLATARKLAS
jgi:deoxyribonuclease-4